MVVEILPLANSNKIVMDIMQGNTMQFMVVFKNEQTSGILSFDDVDNVIVYAYTCPNYIVKSSLVTTPGYNQLVRIDSKNLLGTIEGNQSKLMKGDLFIEVCIKDAGSTFIDGGNSASVHTLFLDGGDSATTPISVSDGGTSVFVSKEEVGINGSECGITIIESNIKNEVL